MSDHSAPFLHVSLKGSAAVVRGITDHRFGQTSLPQSLQTGQEVMAEWSWDGSCAVVRNCRLGFMPVFYYASEAEFAVAPVLSRLLETGVPVELDEGALAVLLRLGFHTGEDTVFRGIRAVPPGGEIRWSDGKTTIAGGYAFPRQQDMTREAAIEGYGELFSRAIRRRVSADVSFGMPLSGGRDSRHILLELAAQGHRPDMCYSTHDFPPYRDENIRVAALLCKRLSIPQHVTGQKGSRVAAEVKKNRITSHGSMEHTWAAGFYREVARHASIVYDGLAGDVLSAGYQLRKEHVRLYEQGRLEQLAHLLFDNWLAQPGYEEALTRVFPGGLRDRFSRDLAAERVSRELEKHVSSPNPLSSFYFWNRTRRGVSLIPFSILPDAGITAVTPYLDHDLIDFLASLPVDMYLDKTFHTETIRVMYPEYSDIPYAGGNNTPVIESNMHYRRFLLESCLYLSVSGSGLLVDKLMTIRRMLALAFMRGGNIRMHMSWVAPFTVLYLAQLGKFCP